MAESYVTALTLLDENKILADLNQIAIELGIIQNVFETSRIYIYYSVFARVLGNLTQTIAQYLNNIDIETTTMIKFGDTKTNLETAIAGEYEEWADMYPEFAKVAEEEWYPQFAARIKAIMVAEKHHEERYKKLHDLVKDELVFKRDEEIYWTCTKCGYVWKGKEPPKVCPLCGHEQGYYVKMNEDF